MSEFIEIKVKGGREVIKKSSVYRIKFDNVDRNYPVRVFCKLGREYEVLHTKYKYIESLIPHIKEEENE